MPPLHITQFVKQFVETLNKGGEAFKSIFNMFPHLSKAQIEGAIFTGPDVHKMFPS